MTLIVTMISQINLNYFSPKIVLFKISFQPLEYFCMNCLVLFVLLISRVDFSINL
jgi:TctA family transporter